MSHHLNGRAVLAAIIVGMCLLTAAAAAASGNVDLPRFPAISPDGGQIVFSWRGDLWKVSSAGGQASRLTSHPGDELQAAWSPDGKRIAFGSNRNGYVNLYLMNADGTDIRQVTDVDRPCALTGFGVDESGREVLTFHSVLEGDVYRDFRPYMIEPEGGDLRRMHDAFGSFPMVSRDGRRIVFARGGYYDGWERRHYRGPESSDVWLHNRGNGEFRRLTTWDGNDGKAKWAGPESLLYLSDRELSCVNLYRMNVARGEAGSTRITSFASDDVQDFDVTADGSRAVLMAWDTLHMLDLTRPGSVPKALTITASEDEADNFTLKSISRNVSEAALSPDGKVMAMIAYGEVYVRNIEDDSLTRRVTNDHAREADIAWSPDGLKLYFTSDRDGTESIYAAAVAMTRGELKEAFEEATSEKEPEPAAEEPENAEPEEADETADAEAEETQAGSDEETDDDNGEAKEEEPELPRELKPERWHDAMTFTIAPVVQRGTNDRMASPSPDGSMLAFRGVRGNLHIMDLETGEIRTLLEHWDMWLHWQWSPDSRMIAFAQADLDFNTDIFIVPADGSDAPVNISRHPDDDVEPQFSADGKILTFLSERVNEETDVWRVYLDEDLESLTPQDLKAYYDEAAKAAKKRKPLKVEPPALEDDDDDDEEGEDADGDEAEANVEKEEETKDAPEPLDLENAYLRVRRVTSITGNEGNNALTPAGDRLIFTATGDSPGLYSVKWDGSDQKRLGGMASVQHVSLTGDKIVLVSGSRAATVKPEGGDMSYVDLDDRIRIDLQAQSHQKFLEAARGLGEGYYHPTMNGTDWPALTGKYLPLARQTRTANEFNWVANRFIGELNGSHLAIRASDPPPANRQRYGRLGTTHVRVEGGFEVTEVLPESPASKGPMALQVGDVITAVEFEPIGPRDTLESLLKDRVGEETVVTIRRTLDDAEAVEVDVLITPISYNAERQLKYEAWRQRNAELVRERTGGRVGYIHIQGMNQPSLDVFERDLFAAASGTDGLIIDVRNNGGGWTTDRVLSSIMVQEHAFTIPRGADPEETGHYPQPRLFIQRYTKPVNLLCNEKSYSNAEIMSHAFKTLGRGTLVGQQTHGSVISTGGWGLIDGTFVRLPFRGWYVNDGNGTDMELHGAMPDLLVPQTPQAETRGEDEQLRAAIDDLLTRLR